MSFGLPKKYEHKSGTIVPRYENVGYGAMRPEI